MKAYSEMSTAELVAEYNRLSGKKIKKFSSRAAGEKQIAKLAEGNPDGAAPEAASAKPSTKKPVERNSAGKQKRRSEAQRESWNSPKVAKARAMRSNVKVSGPTEEESGDFRSVASAFTALNLPMNKHIKFRIELKEAGSATFVHDDKKYRFKVIESAA